MVGSFVGMSVGDIEGSALGLSVAATGDAEGDTVGTDVSAVLDSEGLDVAGPLTVPPPHAQHAAFAVLPSFS